MAVPKSRERGRVYFLLGVSRSVFKGHVSIGFSCAQARERRGLGHHRTSRYNMFRSRPVASHGRQAHTVLAECHGRDILSLQAVLGPTWWTPIFVWMSERRGSAAGFRAQFV